MNPLPSTVGWGAVIVAFVAAVMDSLGVFPPGSTAQVIAKYGGLVMTLVSSLSHSTGLGTFKLPKWFNLIGLAAAILGTIAADPSATAMIGPAGAMWITAAATFANKFAHSLPGNGGTTE